MADKVFGTFRTKDGGEGHIFAMLMLDHGGEYVQTDNPDHAVCVVGEVTSGTNMGQQVAFDPTALATAIAEGWIVLKGAEH